MVQRRHAPRPATLLAAAALLGAAGFAAAVFAQPAARIAEASPTSPAPVSPPLRGEVLELPRERVDAAFSHGEPLVESELFEVHASRRDGPGLGELHVTDTDIFFVRSGSATLVTGGTLVDPEETAPDEVRGPSIAGGTRRAIRAGDVIVIPRGIPHHFERVDAPVTYYVVKVVDAGAQR